MGYEICKYCGKKFVKPHALAKYCSKECSKMYRQLFSKERKYQRGQNDTLCWECKKSTGGFDCPWVKNFTPVEGWDAKATEIRYRNTKRFNSYKVIKCPLYEKG